MIHQTFPELGGFEIAVSAQAVSGRVLTDVAVSGDSYFLAGLGQGLSE